MDLVKDEIKVIREKILSLQERLIRLEDLEQSLLKMNIQSDDDADSVDGNYPNNHSSTVNVQQQSTLSQTTTTTTTTIMNNTTGSSNGNYQVVVRMLEYRYFTTLRQVLDIFPNLITDRKFWILLFQSTTLRSIENSLYDVPDLFFERVPLVIKYDKELMLCACKFDIRFYEYLVIEYNNKQTNNHSATITQQQHPLLIYDEDIITAALNCSPLSILYVDQASQLRYPHLVATAIRQLPLHVDELQTLIRLHLEYNLWKNRTIVVSWIQAGGTFLENHFASRYRDDPDIILEYMKYGVTTGNNRNRSITNKKGEIYFPSSLRLRSDKEFMMNAIEFNGRLLSLASKELIHDFDLILTALSDIDAMIYFGIFTNFKWMQHNQMYHHIRYEGTGNRIRSNRGSSESISSNYLFLIDFAKEVKYRLRSYDNLMTILCAISHYEKNRTNLSNTNNNSRTQKTMLMDRSTKSVLSTSSSSSSSCHLPLLNQGYETNVHAYSKLIGQYINVPTGKYLRKLRQAHHNLSLWGIR